MTTPLWCLLAMLVWCVLLVGAVIAIRAVKVVSGDKAANEFPSGEPHGSDFYWRLNRAHINCAENFPLFAAAVLIATFLGITTPVFAALAQLYLGARIIQTTMHLISGSPRVVHVRFTFFVIQLGLLLTMAGMIVREAT